MKNTNTSVLARRLRIAADYSTSPHEAGWATEALFFVQAEGPHPDLTITPEVSPDGITWARRGDDAVLPATDAVAMLPLVCFGNWIRLRVTGASADATARILIHVNLKG